MNKQESRIIADKNNSALIEEFYQKNPMDRVYAAIKEAAESGEYTLNYSIPLKFRKAVLLDLKEKLEAKGYKVESSFDMDRREFDVAIRWDF